MHFSFSRTFELYCRYKYPREKISSTFCSPLGPRKFQRKIVADVFIDSMKKVKKHLVDYLIVMQFNGPEKF